MLVWLNNVNIAEGIAETVVMNYAPGGTAFVFAGYTATWRIIQEGAVWASGPATLNTGVINVPLSALQTAMPKPTKPQKLNAAGVLEVTATNGSNTIIFNATVIVARREDSDAGIGIPSSLAPEPPPSSPPLLAESNLSDLDDAPTARTNLGLGTIATQNANAVTITGGTITGLSSALPVASGGTGQTTLAHLRAQDRIINGTFDVWQRATSGTANGYTAADRWANFHTGGTVTQARQTFAPGNPFGPNNPQFFLRQSVSGQSGSNFATTQHRIEDVRTYAGATVTVLGWAKRASGTGNLGVRMAQNFGTGGSPSSEVVQTQQIVTLTTSWVPFAATFTLPSITGLTIGTDGNSFVSVSLDASNGTLALGVQTIEVDLWGVHLRVGTHAATATADYVAPPLSDTLRACQRYYETGFSLLESYQLSANAVSTTAVFKETKRAGPTVSVADNGSAFLTATFSVPSVSLDSARLTGTKNGVSGAFLLSVSWIATAEI